MQRSLYKYWANQKVDALVLEHVQKVLMQDEDIANVYILYRLIFVEPRQEVHDLFEALQMQISEKLVYRAVTLDLLDMKFDNIYKEYEKCIKIKYTDRQITVLAWFLR